jgi:hypothetical protein
MRVSRLHVAILLVWLASCAADASGQMVRLAEAVEVRGESVRLADLLPVGVPEEIRRASAEIEICRAPQPGSVRVLRQEEISRRVSEAAMLRQMVIPERIVVRRSGWAMDRAALRIAIAKFLRQQAPDLDLPENAQVRWPEWVVATEQHPALEVTGWEWDERQQAPQFRVRCAKGSSCGSFWAVVSSPPSLLSPTTEKWRARLASAMGVNSEGATAATLPAMAEKGKPATLILEDGAMRISLRVTCLQRGVLHQRIRVFDERSRRAFRAEVIGSGLLQATL